MTYFFFTGIINAVTSFALAALFLTRGARSEINIVFSFYCLGLFLISVFSSLVSLPALSSSALLLHRLATVPILLISPLHVHFWACATKRRSRMDGWLKASYAITVMILPLLLSPLHIQSIEPVGPFPAWAIAGPLHPIQIAHFVGFFLMSIGMQSARFRESSGRQREQMLYCIIATSLGYIGGGMTFLLNYRIPVPLWGNPLISVYILIMAYSVLQQHLLELTLALRSGVVYSLLLVLIGTPFAVLAWWPGQSVVSGAVAFVAPLVGYFLIGKWKAGIIDAVSHLPLFRGRYEGFKEVKKLKNILPSVQTVEDLANALVRAVSGVLKLRSASVLFFDPSLQAFTQMSAVGPASADSTQLDLENPLAKALTKSGVLIRALLEDFIPALLVEPVRRGMELFQAEVCAPMFNADGSMEGVVNIGQRADGAALSDQDITTAWDFTRAAEEALRDIRTREVLVKQGRLVAIGQMASVVSHELKAPLAVIQSSTHFLENRLIGSDDPKMLKHIGIINTQAQSLNSVISGILDYTGDRKLKLEWIDLDDLIKEVAGTLPLPGGVRVDLRLAGVPRGQFDREEMKRILVNLIQNAVHAMQGAGDLSIHSSVVPGELVEIKVSDTGCGIPPEHLPKIFEPFFTTKPAGTGLGMAVVKKALERHRGDIRVQSAVGKGTTFILSLPLRQEERQE